LCLAEHRAHVPRLADPPWYRPACGPSSTSNQPQRRRQSPAGGSPSIDIFAVGIPSSRPPFSPCRIGPSTGASGPASQQRRGDGLWVNRVADRGRGYRNRGPSPSAGQSCPRRRPHLGTEGLQCSAGQRALLPKRKSSAPRPHGAGPTASDDSTSCAKARGSGLDKVASNPAHTAFDADLFASLVVRGASCTHFRPERGGVWGRNIPRGVRARM